MSGYEDFVEYRKKKQKEREVAASRYALKNPTIDDNFINNYIAQSESFVNNTINDYSTANYEGLDDFRSALDSFESQASTLRAQRLLIEDAFNKLPESKNKQDALDFLNGRANSINKTWELLKKLRSDFDGEESNFYQYKFGNNVTYDNINDEINRLLERQKTESDTDSKETQKSIDVLSNLKYNTNYNSLEDYDKAILDATEKVKKLEEDDKTKVVITASSGKRNTEEITFLKNQIAKLQANKELAEFYEIPNKAGAKFVEYWAEEYKKNSANPTVDEILNWFNTGHESGDTIAINDPLGFVEDNPDLYGQYNPSSNIGTLVLPIFDKAHNYHWEQISDKERDVYYYTLGTKGKEEALRYLDLLAPTFGQRFRDKLSQAFSDVYDKHGVLAYVGLNAASVPLSAIGGLMATVDNFADMATEGKINPYSQINNFRIAGETIREETAKDIEASTSAEFLGKNILSEVYQLGMSFIDSTVGGAIMGPAYSFVLGSGAAASEAEEVYNRGGTPGQIFAASFAAGLSETIAEFIPLNKLFGEGKPNVTSLRQGMKTALSQAMTEASEEFLTEITNTIVDDVIMQERSAINERAAYLMEQGMSSGEAYGKAFSELLSDVAWAPLGGFATGGFGGATLSTASAISNRGYIGYVNRVGKAIKSTGDAQNLIDYAKQFDTDEINDLLKGTTAKSSNNKIGQIYQAVVEATRSDMSKIQSHADLARYIESKANSTSSQNIKNILGIEYFNTMQNTYWKDGVDNWSNLRANTALGGKGNAPEISNVRQYASGNDYVMGNYTDPTEQDAAEEETESILPNISAQGPEADPVADAAFKARGVERLTDDQKFIKKVGKAFGREVIFENLDEWRTDENGKKVLFSPNGYFNKNTNQIVINSKKKTLNALEFVFKHELAHFVENNSKEKYDKFVKALKESKEFEKWLNKKLGSSDGTLDVKLASLNERIRDERKKVGKPVGVAEAEAEIVADFVGQILFEKNGTTLDSLVKNTAAKNKPFIIQWLLDAVKWLKEKLSGNKDFSFELQRLESKFVAMLKDAQKNAEQKTAQETTNSTEGGVEYSIVKDSKNRNIVLLDRNIFKNIEDLEARSEALGEWILNTFGGKKYNTSDYRFILVNERTAGKIKFWNENMDESAYNIKLSAAEHIDELIKLSKHDRHERNFKDKHKEFAKHGWDYFKSYFTDGVRVYEAYMSAAKTDNGSVLYNIGNIEDKGKFEHKKESSYSLTGSPNELATILDYEASNKNSNDSIPKFSENVNSYSMQENEENSENEQYSVSPEEQDVDYTAKFDELSQQFERGDITRADFVEQVKALYTEAGNTYGTIEKGEAVTGNENFKNPVPKTVDGAKNVRRYVRTVMEGGDLTEDMLTVEKQQVLSGDVSYTPTSNEANMKYADNAMVNGTAETIWEGITKGTAAPNAGAIAVGEALLKDAINRKDTVSVVTLVAELSELGTRLGQSVQALSLLKRMSGVGQLYYVKKAVDKLNKDLQRKHKNNPPTVVINETLANQLAESTTEEDFNISYAAIMNDIAEQVPATFLDKWNAWRYMAMLFNPVTHIRNFFGNAFFVPVVMTKDAIATGIESTFLKDKSKRSKAVLLKKEYLDFAKKDFVFVENKLKSGGKYNPSRGITENKKIFKGVLEKARQFNFDLLEREDAVFLKAHYARAMASYLQSQKVNIKTASPETITLAREYAQKEALKATYRDMSALANVVSNIANKNVVANVFVDGILPFKKTPINIIKRGIEYSPLGLMWTLTKGFYDLKKGNITASEFIDGIAGGLTGTGIVAVGMLFSSLGLVVGGLGDDEESWYDKMLGKQEYALEIGNVSYTIDWMAPACMPFFMGVSIAEAMREEGNENLIASVVNSLTSSIEPYINLSMLSGIRNTIATARYADEKEIFSKVFGEMVGNYASQLLPAIGAKLANTIDDTRRLNYIDKTSILPEFIQKAINTTLSKSPVASMLRPEYINAWGESENQGNFAKRFFQSFLSPGYVSSIEVDNVDVELKRLAKETGESGVFPKSAPKKVEFKGITKNLTAEEYVYYATQKGQLSADFVSDAIKNPKYKQLDDSQKANVIKNLYSYANVKAKLKINYTSEEISQMYDKLSAKDKENATSKKDAVKQAIIQSEKGAYNYEINGGDVVEYYIEKESSKK